MEEICVNEYVRTDMGICKIVKINKKDKLSLYIIDKFFPNYDLSFINLGMITKHSPNIIDVLEIGDIVTMKYRHLDVIKPLDETDIADLKSGELKFVSVVTHQQFNSIKYEVI